jgi:hypothetical protein
MGWDGTGWMDGWMDGWRDRWMGGWMGWDGMDGYITARNCTTLQAE